MWARNRWKGDLWEYQIVSNHLNLSRPHNLKDRRGGSRQTRTRLWVMKCIFIVGEAHKVNMLVTLFGTLFGEHGLRKSGEWNLFNKGSLDTLSWTLDATDGILGSSTRTEKVPVEAFGKAPIAIEAPKVYYSSWVVQKCTIHHKWTKSELFIIRCVLNLWGAESPQTPQLFINLKHTS